jgi:hypothetical protein
MKAPKLQYSTILFHTSMGNIPTYCMKTTLVYSAEHPTDQHSSPLLAFGLLKVSLYY